MNLQFLDTKVDSKERKAYYQKGYHHSESAPRLIDLQVPKMIQDSVDVSKTFSVNRCNFIKGNKVFRNS